MCFAFRFISGQSIYVNQKLAFEEDEASSFYSTIIKDTEPYVFYMDTYITDMSNILAKTRVITLNENKGEETYMRNNLRQLEQNM